MWYSHNSSSAGARILDGTVWSQQSKQSRAMLCLFVAEGPTTQETVIQPQRGAPLTIPITHVRAQACMYKHTHAVLFLTKTDIPYFAFLSNCHTNHRPISSARTLFCTEISHRGTWAKKIAGSPSGSDNNPFPKTCWIWAHTELGRANDGAC